MSRAPKVPLATLIGAEGDSALEGGVIGDSTVGATLLDATQWHLGTLVPLREGS